MSTQRVLGIETSCDDTSVAVVRSDGFVESLCSANQDLTHSPFGGIVPELASRNHTEAILPLVDEALLRANCRIGDLHGIAVTSRPGLVGSLLVGVVTAKALSLAHSLPFVGVNHIEAHLLAGFLKDDKHRPPPDFAFPFVGLAVSGGHSHLFKVSRVGQYEILGRTLDDAAGEAFDKFAKMLGLGFPGGAAVDQLAHSGDPQKFSFPRGMIREENLDFSFSGLKTSAMNLLAKLSTEERRAEAANLCASFQEAVVEVLITKLERAGERIGCRTLVITGGVSANSRLRQAAETLTQKGYLVVIPPLRYCTDNAAMVAYTGACHMSQGEFSGQDLGPSAASLATDFIDFGRG